MNSSLFILIFLLHLSSLSTAILCIPTERDTLLKFKHSLTDPSHRLSSWNASSNSNCCLWHGVVCSNITSHVLQLHLNTSPPNVDDYIIFGRYVDTEAYDKAYEDYNITVFGGEINPCLVDLKHLNYLDLSGNYFGRVPIPSFLVKMSSLTHLNLSHAGFMGNIPSQIGNLSNLLQLDLSYAANGTIPSQIANLSNLLYLDLQSAYDESLLAENLDWLSSLSKLQYLDLSRNHLLGGGMPIPSFIGTMTSLSHLDLSSTGFMGDIPYQIGNLSNLVYLDLSYAANGTIPSQIGNLFNLVYLDLQSTLFAENIDWLSNFSKLEYLDLRGANLSKSFDWLHTLQALPSLKHLDLSRCVLPDHYNEPSLLNFSSLFTLDLSYIYYSAAFSSVPKWIFGLKKLVSLQLRGNQIQGPIPDGIQNLTLLETLDLSYNSFSSSIPDWLYSLHHLKSLNLGSNKLHGNISDALGNLTSLVGLDLSYNQLEGTIPISLGSQLFRHLDLSKNHFSGNLFESLRSLSSLLYLDIDDNHFQGVVKEDDLANLTSLKMFHASGNNFTLKVGPNWHPTFQVTDLSVSSWQLGPNFPSWIRSQKELGYLQMSNTGILDSIPTWFWEAFSQAYYLNLSHNHIHGELAITLSIEAVDLSTNNLCGKLPFISNHVYRLDISGNSLSESMGDFLCKQQGKPIQVEFLNLASNNLSGELPDCWMI